MKGIILAVSVLLAGCFDEGGPSQPYVQVDGPEAVAISDLGAYPLSYELPAAGTYEFLFEGEADCSAPAEFRANFSFSGQGGISGDTMQQYELASCVVPANIKLRATLTAHGSGPWVMQVLLLPMVMPGPELAFSDLRLSVRTR